MRFLAATLIFFAVLTVSFALRCYVATSADKNYKPTSADATTCPAGSNSYCIKQVIDGKVLGQKIQASSFLCAPAAACTDTKCHKSDGVNTCCCTGDLCNSGFSLKYAPVIATLLLAKLF